MRCLFPIFFLLIGLSACLKTLPPEPDNRPLTRELIHFPGKAFDHILMGRIQPGDPFTHPDSVFPKASVEPKDVILGKTHRLIPAHQADVMVALAYQDLYLPQLPTDCTTAYDYAFFFVDEEGVPVAHFRYDIGCILISIDGPLFLPLSKIAEKRLQTVINEVNWIRQ